MRLKDLMVGVILLSFVILSCVGYMNNVGDNYNKTGNISIFNSTMNNLNSQVELVNKTTNILANTKFQSDISVFYIPYNMMLSAWNVIQLILSGLTLPISYITDIVNEFTILGITIPAWVKSGIICLISIGFLILIVELFFRWKLE